MGGEEVKNNATDMQTRTKGNTTMSKNPETVIDAAIADATVETLAGLVATIRAALADNPDNAAALYALDGIERKNAELEAAALNIKYIAPAMADAVLAVASQNAVAKYYDSLRREASRAHKLADTAHDTAKAATKELANGGSVPRLGTVLALFAGVSDDERHDVAIARRAQVLASKTTSDDDKRAARGWLRENTTLV
jgi:predicted O-linked N-acetylglucosamine transferase (SPINDLY family)